MRTLSKQQLRRIKRIVKEGIAFEIENFTGKQNAFKTVSLFPDMDLTIDFNVNVEITETRGGTYHSQAEHSITKERIDDANIEIWDDDEYEISDSLFDLICKNIILE